MNKRILLESLSLLLVLYFFQDVLCKIVYWDVYGSWLQQVPYLQSAVGFWKYTITIFELLISFGMVFPKARVAMAYTAIAGLLLAIVQILVRCIFQHHLFFPFHLLWFHHVKWFDVLTAQVLLAWVALAILWINNATRNSHKMKLSILKP
jgi:hypothetical protein